MDRVAPLADDGATGMNVIVENDQCSRTAICQLRTQRPSARLVR